MTDDTQPIDAVIAAGHTDSRLLAAADLEAWRLNLGYGPDGIDYQPTSSARVRSRKDEGPDQVAAPKVPPGSTLSRAWNQSVQHRAHAVVVASELSWVADNVAQLSVLPKRRSHYDKRTGDQLLAVVRSALTIRMTASRWFADQVYLRQTVSLLRRALTAMPPDLWRVSPDAQPDVKLCPGYALHTCGEWIGYRRKRCGSCQTAADRIRQLSHGEHDGACTNPWGRVRCTGSVDVAKWGLCRGCDQYRRDGQRSVA